MRDACVDSGTELAEFNGEPSHVHLLASFPPTVALSRLVNSLKSMSSRRMRQESPAWPGFTGGVGEPPATSSLRLSPTRARHTRNCDREPSARYRMVGQPGPRSGW